VRRIAIVGCPGSGKTTLARVLGPRVRLPVIHLDREYWLPGWREPTGTRWMEKHDALIDGEKWLIEGGYLQTGKDRIQRADLVILLDFPLPVCFFRVVKRTFQDLGRLKADGPVGCPGRFNFSLLVRTLKYKYRHRRLGDFIRKNLPGTGKMVTIRSDNDIERLLSEIA